MQKNDKVQLSKCGKEKLQNTSFPLDSKGVVIAVKQKHVTVQFEGRDCTTSIDRKFLRKRR